MVDSSGEKRSFSAMASVIPTKGDYLCHRRYASGLDMTWYDSPMRALLQTGMAFHLGSESVTRQPRAFPQGTCRLGRLLVVLDHVTP